MRKLIVFLFVFLILLTSYKQEKVTKNDKIVKEDKVIKNVNIIYNDSIINMDLEKYIIGVVACEMPSSFEVEALKAMAVSARTFALYKIETNNDYKFSTTTKDQCYISVDKMKSNWKSNFVSNYNKIKNAVMDTSNQYMTYNDKVIISFYFSISNGYTENCENVFSQKLDYLKSVDSSWDKDYSYKEKSIKMSLGSFMSKLGIKDKSIFNIEYIRNSTNRIDKIIINNHKYKGTEFRKLLSLRSTDIEISVLNNEVIIKTKGYGHGVGMSQYGANSMALKGYKYDEILKYYYNGIKIMNK